MDKKILTKMISGAAMLLLLAACTQDELADGGNTLPEGKYPLEIASVTMDVTHSQQPWNVDVPQTRVSESDDRNSSMWQNGDRIKVQIADGTPGTYTYQDGRLTVAVGDVPAYWASKAGNQSIRAWYTSSGNETINLDNQTNGLAYVLTAQATANFNESVSLAFDHALAKVRVALMGSDADRVDDVKIMTYTSCTLNADGTLTAGDTKDYIPMVQTTYKGETCWEANVVPGKEITKFQMNGTTTGTLANGGIKPLAAKVNTITLTVGETSLQPGEDGQFTINEGDDVTIKDYEGTAPIVVNGDATITLNNVKLNTNDNVMTINNGATVTLNIEGVDNELTSTGGAGIKIMETTNSNQRGSITIIGTSANSSKLKVTAANGAAIGFRMYGGVAGSFVTIYGGNIEIKNITLEAQGGSGSPAIGLSALESDNVDGPKTYGNISIEASTLTVSSTGGAACIGTPNHNTSSPFSLGIISIRNSTVTATAEGNQAACIGFGYTANTAGNFKKVIQKIEFTSTTLHLTTDAGNKVGFGDGDDSRQLTEGIWNNESKVGETSWNP